MFAYKVKTDKGVKEGKNYFTVIAHGTKRDMLEMAKTFDAHPETVASRVVREKDGKAVHCYERQ